MPNSSLTRLSLKPLEPRLTPANNVTAQLVGPDLWIRGDDAGNGVSVFRMPSGRFRLEGGENAVTHEVTTVNGEGVNVTEPVRGHVRIELLGGDDFLLLGDPTARPLRVPAELTVDTGDGADIVVGVARAGGSLSVDTGADNDFLEARLVAGGSLTIGAGDGDDRVLWEGGRARSATISGGDGDQDLLYLGKKSLTGDVTVIGELAISESELVSLNDPALGYDSTTRIGGSFSVRADGLVGLIDMTRVRVGGDLGLTTGTGNDSIALSGVRARNLAIETGDGDDFVAFGGTGAFANVAVRDNLTVHTGDGNDFVNFNLFFTAANSAASYTHVGNWAIVETGQGDDIVQAYTIRPVRGLLIESGDGNDDVAVVQASVPILVVSLGDGDDSLAMAWTRAEGFADGGAGMDRVFHRNSRNLISGLTRSGFEEEG
jgi:hypothetical protein